MYVQAMTFDIQFRIEIDKHQSARSDNSTALSPPCR